MAVEETHFACVVCGGAHQYRYRSQMIGMTMINKRLRYPCPEIERIDPTVQINRLDEVTSSATLIL